MSETPKGQIHEAVAPQVQDEHIGAVAVHNLAQVSVGYSVEMLGSEVSVPAREALLVDVESRAEHFAQDYMNGTVPTVLLKDAWTAVQRQGKPGFVTYFKVSQADIAAQGIPEDLFAGSKLQFQYPGADEKQKLINADDQAGLADFARREGYAQQLDDMISPQDRHNQLKAWYGQCDKKVDRMYVDDLSGVEKKNEGLETLHQAFELTDTVAGEKVGGIRVLNFSETPLTQGHIEDISGALRNFSERTGGAIYDNFDNIVYIPQDHPSLKVEARMADGTKKQVNRRGYMAPRTLVLSELVMLPPDQQPPTSVESTEFFHSYLLPGESAEGPDAPVKTVAQGRHKGTVAHEMTHMALERNDMPTARSLYSRFNPTEHDAEVGAAQYLGEEHLVPVDADESAAFEAKWQWLRRKAAQDGRPQGDHFVTARQHDLSQGPLPRRFKRPGEPLATEVTYRLVD